MDDDSEEVFQPSSVSLIRQSSQPSVTSMTRPGNQPSSSSVRPATSSGSVSSKAAQKPARSVTAPGKVRNKVGAFYLWFLLLLVDAIAFYVTWVLYFFETYIPYFFFFTFSSIFVN